MSESQLFRNMVQFLLNLGIVGKERGGQKRSGAERWSDGCHHVFDGNHRKKDTPENICHPLDAPPPARSEQTMQHEGFFFEDEVRIKRLDCLLRRGRMDFFVPTGEVQYRSSTGHEGNHLPTPKGSTKVPGEGKLCNSQQFPNLREIDTDFTRGEIPLEPSKTASIQITQ